MGVRYSLSELSLVELYIPYHIYIIFSRKISPPLSLRRYFNILFHLTDTFFHFFIKIFNSSVISCRHIFWVQHKICRRQIICNRYIIDYRYTKQRFYVRIMWLCFQRIPKKNHKINVTLYNFRANLLVASKWSTVISFYFKSCSFCNKSGSCSRSAQRMCCFIPLLKRIQY